MNQDRRLYIVFPLSLISGLPLGILVNSVVAWLKSDNIDVTIITGFYIAKISYSLKPFWSPVLDVYKVPFIGFLGKRRSWMVFTSALMCLTCIIISFINPLEDILNLKILIIILIFLSSTYDAAYDAFRIEMLDHDQQSTGLTNAGIGYRAGVLISSAFAFWVSHFIGWNNTFIIFASIFLLGSIFILVFTNELNTVTNIETKLSSLYRVLFITVKDVIFQKQSYLIIPAIIFYKLGDAMLAAVSTPFFLDIGYTLKQLALVVKIYGLIAVLIGGYGASYVMKRYGDIKGLIICGIFQALTNLTYYWLNVSKKTLLNLGITICAENFAGGMGAVALVTYLTRFCEKKHVNTATNYAILCSFATLMNTTVISYAGTIVSSIGWNKYFIFTVLLSIPGVVIFLVLSRCSERERKISRI